MALPSNSYVPFQGIQTHFSNKDDGEPLSAGYVEFYKDVARTVSKDVFQQVQLPDNTYNFVNIGSVLTLSSIGTFQSPNDGTDIQAYAYPYDDNGNIELYYLKVYSSGAVLQLTREAMPPNVLNSSGTDLFEGSDNQIENPQFVVTLLPASLTNVYTVSGTQSTPIAPDWSIETTGSGTVTVTQEALTDIVMPTGAPFAINISSAGITTLKLRQRITQSPRIFGNGATTSYVSGMMVAKNFGAASIQLVMDYVASNGYTVNLVTQSTSTDGSYTVLNTADTGAKSVAINSTNTNSPNTPGYVDIDITIPVSSTAIGITSVQLVATENVTSSTQFLQVSTPRQIDHLFHYYKDPLIYKPIPSYLVGWDFPLNPSQLGATVAASAIGANKSKYVWDQTIVFQSANSGVGVTRGSSNELVLTAAATTQMAIVQYLGPNEARKILNAPICVNVSARASVATLATVSLWYTTDASLPVITTGTNNSIVLTLDANGKPATNNGTWSEVPRTQGNAQFTIGTSATTNFNDYALSGWDMAGVAACNTATFFAIVVGTASVTSTGTIGFNSVSLQAGTIPTRPAPQSADEVLRECQYYYEKSYENASVAGTAVTTVGQRYVLNELGTRIQGVLLNDDVVYLQSFGLTYLIPKRAAATPVFYSPTSASAGLIQGRVLRNGSDIIPSGVGAVGTSPQNYSSANWTVTGSSTQGVNMICNSTSTLVYASGSTTPGLEGDESMMLFHYVCDARLGVV